MQRRFRLHHSGDFARLRREGRVYRHPLMILNLAPNTLPHNRYGFITSKRLGNAVTRNRTRRLMREAVRQLHPQFQPGFDIVIVARPIMVGQPFITVLRTMDDMFSRAGLIMGNKS